MTPQKKSLGLGDRDWSFCILSTCAALALMSSSLILHEPGRASTVTFILQTTIGMAGATVF